MKFRRRLPQVSSSYLATIVAITALSAAPASAQNFLVEYIDEKLSIQANNTRVKELLLEIQDKTGIKVNFIADPKDTVSLNINDQTVEHAIAKITANHMIIHDFANGKKTISELIIISDDPELRSSGTGSANLPSGQPAPAVTPEPNQPGQPNSEPTTEPASNPIGNAPPAPTDSPKPASDSN